MGQCFGGGGCLLACFWRWYQDVCIGPKHQIVYIKYVCSFVCIEYTSVELRKINSYGSVRILYGSTTSVCRSEGCAWKAAAPSSAADRSCGPGTWTGARGLMVVPGTACFHSTFSCQRGEHKKHFDF